MNVHFITEDKSDSPFVKLYRAAYDFEVLDCAGSNSLLEDTVLDLYKRHKGDCFVAYLDIVPDNVELLTIYNNLLKLVVKNPDLDLVVVPIPCAEYAFICSVNGIQSAFHSTEGLSSVLSKSPRYKDDSLSSRLGGAPRSFERFCKRFCSLCLSDKCCAIKSNKEAKSKPYFKGSCSCPNCSVRLSMRDKGMRYVSQLHIVPASRDFTSKFSSWDDVIKESWKVVDAYNKWADSFEPKAGSLIKFPLRGR